MKPVLLTGILGAFCLFSFSQEKSPTPVASYDIDRKICRAYFPIAYIGSTGINEIKKYLLKELPHLSIKGIDITCKNIIESPEGLHYTFFQSYKGIELYNGQIKINTDKRGRVLSLFDNSYSVTAPFSEVFPDPELIKYFISSRKIGEYKTAPIFFPSKNTFVPAIIIQAADDENNIVENIMNIDGTIIYSKDLTMYFSKFNEDSTIVAGVFLPNPLVSAGVFYGSPYTDDENGDVQQLNAEIVQLPIGVKYENGVFSLESPWVKITEHSAPVTIPATSSIPEFIYTRSQAEFEDVNAFYHINKYQLYIQSLGFTNLVNYQIQVDAHALNGADQSTFNPAFTPHRLNYGTGGVDDAEDAHVLIHEYGHAIMHSASPNTNSGSERMALDEANADYFAVSYSKALNLFSWEKVFSWDGHNPFWSGRNAASLKKYPHDLGNSIYLNGEIWSSTLMQINGAIGRELTDQILLQSAYSYAANITMADAARLFIQAEQLLTGGNNKTDICYYFQERGLNSCTPENLNEMSSNLINVSILNSAEFAKGSGSAIITLPFDLNATLEIFDGTGRLISIKAIKSQNSIGLSPSDFKSGIYFLKFQSTFNLPVVKLIRF